MNSDQKWLVYSFLTALEGLRLTEHPPMHVIDRRLALVDMVLTELPGDDPDELSLRAIAEAVRDACLDPNPDTMGRYSAAVHAHLELLRSVFPGLC